MALILEDENVKLGGRQVTLPKYLVDNLYEKYNLYSGDEYKTSKGYKRLHSLLNKSYNNPSDKKDRQHNNNFTISFADLKRIDFDMRHMLQNKNNAEYDMIGGDLMRDFVHNALESLRTSTKQVKPVPQVPKVSAKDVKPQNIVPPVKPRKSDIGLGESDFSKKIKVMI